MKKILSTVLAAALLVGTFALGGMSASAAELELHQNAPYGQLGNTGGCGFIDGNLYFTTGLKAESLSDVKVEVNGKTAHWNIGYQGTRHCNLNDANDIAKSWLQVGIVGADLVVGENTLTVSAGGDTYTHTFTSTARALGVSYSKVETNAQTKKTEVELVFNTDPKLAVGTTFEGRAHDDHNNTAEFKVTKYDSKTGLYTIEGDYTTGNTLLELKVTSEGDYKDAWITATINTKSGAFVGDKKVTQEATKITITEATANRGDASKLIDGKVDKLECGIPSEADPITITFKTGTAVKPDYLVIYTGGDDASWINRAPGAFKLYGVSGETETLILEKNESGMQNVNFTPFAFAVDNNTAYDTFKLVITSRISLPQLDGQWYNDWFQIGEIELYTGSVTVSDSDRYETVTGAVAFNGTAPVVEPTKPADPTKPVDPTKPAPTGDIAVALSALALISVAGAVVVVKKRKIED